MTKLAFALALFASLALTQTPNLSPGPPLEGVTNPVVCLPIGKTPKGDLVYSMDCRDIPASTGLNNVPEGSAAYVGDRFFPSTLATTVPTAADFYNPPTSCGCLTPPPRPPRTKSTFPPPIADLLPGTWRCSSPRHFASWKTQTGARARASTIS